MNPEDYVRGTSEITNFTLLIERASILKKQGSFFGFDVGEEYVSAFRFLLVKDTGETYEGIADYYTFNGTESTPTETDQIVNLVRARGNAGMALLITAIQAAPTLQGAGYYIRGTQKRIHKDCIKVSNLP